MLTINKAGVTREFTTRHLIKNNFDISLTLKSIDEERYSLTERIFRRYKDEKEEALEKVAYAIEVQEKLIRNFWLEPEQLHKLKPEVVCLLTIIEWLNYDGWERFNCAIYFHFDIVTDQIKKQLSLP